MREKIAIEKRRPDGRAADEIRAIATEVGVTPRTHGSGLFTRGQTQALTLVTLGTAKEEQRIDDLSLDTKKRYIHHYNFPPFSVGETGFMRGPKRRDIGHGALAERALVPVIPDAETFPYTMRVVSEILESNGSSSMASVCGSTMALMDAGVPITSPVAGIAMGLIKEGENSIVLTDIQGAEDHLGDMDFKVAGTKDGITALQMDIKITGVSADLLRQALAQAREARLSILASMAQAISEPRTELSPYAPQVVTVKIDSDQIGLIIGKGGETIRGLEEEFDCKIDIEEDGFVRIYASSAAMGEGCRQRIEEMTRPIGVGTVYRDRKVVKTAEFGAFVELRKGTDGLLHASRISPGVRVDSVDQVLTRGDVVTVEVTEVDTERGRVGLKLVSKTENGAEITAEAIGVRYKEQFPNAGQGGGQRPPRDGERSGGGGREPAASAPGATAVAAAAAVPSSDLREVRAAGLAVSLAGDESAPPLVLLHGLAERRQVFDRLMPLLVAAPARRSRSTSRASAASPPLPGGGFDLGVVCERVAAVIAELGLERPAMLGHSLGGGVAVRYAAERPGALRALTLIAPAGLIATGAVRPSRRHPRLHALGRRALRAAIPLIAAQPRPARARVRTRRRRLRRSSTRRSRASCMMGAAQGRSTPAAGIEIVYAGPARPARRAHAARARGLGRARSRRLPALRRAGCGTRCPTAASCCCPSRARADVRGAGRGAAAAGSARASRAHLT